MHIINIAKFLTKYKKFQSRITKRIRNHWKDYNLIQDFDKWDTLNHLDLLHKS